MNQDQLKQAVAQAAVDFILPKLDDKSIVGVGTGSTANCFIDALAQHKGAFDGAVASSEATAATIFSRVNAAPPPLIRFRCSSLSSAPSI